MDSFTGLKALRKTIELVLQKLNMYQDKMNEISREELLEIMGNNDLDLSWIASQESVSNVDAKVEELKGLIVDAIEKVDTAIALCETNTSKIDELNDLIIQIGSKDDPSFGGYHVAAVGVLANNWNYTLDEDNMIVTLTSYKGTDGNVVVYDKFELDGLYYKTKLTASDIVAGKSVESILFHNKIINNITSVAGMFKDCSSLETVDFGNSWVGKTFTNMDYMFKGCWNLTTINNMIDTSQVTSMKYTFYESKKCPSTMDVSKVIDASYCFYGYKGYNTDYMWLNFERVEIFDHAFANSKNPGFPERAVNVKNLNYAFNGCTINDVNRSIVFSTEAKPTSLKFAFANITGIRYNGSPIELCIRQLNLTEAESIAYLFAGCSTLKSKLYNSRWVGPIPDNCDRTGVFDNSCITSLLFNNIVI